MAKRKRRPGGGRKPMGNVAKSAVFTTRIEPATRRALNEAARANDLTVSVTAERLLKLGLEKPVGAARNLSLGCVVTLLAEELERDTEKKWPEDQFTREALVSAVVTLLAYIAPEKTEPVEVPPAVEAAAARKPQAQAQQYCTPDTFGYERASFLLDEIRQATPSYPINEWSKPIFFSDKPAQLALIGQSLGISPKKEGKSK